MPLWRPVLKRNIHYVGKPTQLSAFPNCKWCKARMDFLFRVTPSMQLQSLQHPSQGSNSISHPCQRPRLFSNIQTHGKLLAVQLHPGFPISFSLNQRHRMWSSPLSHSNSSDLLGIISSSDSSPENWRLQVISLPSCPKHHSVLASIQEKHLSKGICSSRLADSKTTGYLILGEQSLMATSWEAKGSDFYSELCWGCTAHKWI